MHDGFMQTSLLLGIILYAAARVAISKFPSDPSDDGRQFISDDWGFNWFWEGQPMDWLSAIGCGALIMGLAIAIVCEVLVLLLAPHSQSVGSMLRKFATDYPFAIFLIGGILCHFLWEMFKPR